MASAAHWRRLPCVHSVHRLCVCLCLRRAQNRYREKQKAKMLATEQEYEDTAAELERARLENLHLREREVTMQQVLSVRDFAMNLLLNSKVSGTDGAKSEGS